MTTDPLQPDRLLRKRNRSLQKQLDVTLQILNEEYRLCKEHMYKEERDCGKFLQSLYETVPGLQSYGQPNTRCMTPNDVFRQRRFTTATPPGHTDVDTVAHTNGNPHGPQDSPNTRKTPAHSAEAGSRQQTKWGGDNGQTGKESGTRTSDKRRLTQRLGLGVRGRDSGSGRVANRPHTAGPHRAHSPGHQSNKPDRPMTSFGFRKESRPCFGKSAYSDHDKSVQELVLKRFQDIFDPEVRRDVKLTTSVSTVMLAMTQESSSTPSDLLSSSVIDARGMIVDHAHNHVPQLGSDHVLHSVHNHVSKLGKDSDYVVDSAHDLVPDISNGRGDQTHSGHQKRHYRRVVWSARPSRKTATVSAPDMDALKRPASAMDQAYSKPRPQSCSLPGGSQKTANGHVVREQSVLDPRIRALALQRSWPGDAEADHHPAQYIPHSGCGEDSANTSDSQQTTDPQLHSHHGLTQTAQRPSYLVKSNSDTNILTNSQITANSNYVKRDSAHSNHVRKDSANSSYVKKDSANSSYVKKDSTNSSYVKKDSVNSSYVKKDSANSSFVKRDPSSQTAGTRVPQGIQRRHSTVTSRRLSDASALVAPNQLVDKLMNAGWKPCSQTRRPKTAPSKSEVSHRLVPVSRQTVVAILTEIENQKASIRNMLTASKDLKHFVKKLVPPELRRHYDSD